MTFPPINADENAQIAWPEPPSPVEVRNAIPPRQQGDAERQNTTGSASKSGEHRMTWKDFINISISMAGAQIAWTLELGYGTSRALIWLSHKLNNY
jgi:solute carrier family 45, member 1/2/4